MKVIEASNANLSAWAELRNALWPGDLDAHRAEIDEMLSDPSQAAFLLVDEDEISHGFIEGKYYQAKDQRYGHVEGWYLAPEMRGKGYGQMLMSQLEAWFLHHSIACFHSDTIEAEYPLSKQAHLNNGYEEAYSLRIFVKNPR